MSDSWTLEMELMDQLMGQAIPMAKAFEWFDDETRLCKAIAAYIERGVVEVMQRNQNGAEEPIPKWKVKEILRSPKEELVNEQQQPTLFLHVTDLGVRLFEEGDWESI